jgi:hypothetical protein
LIDHIDECFDVDRILRGEDRALKLGGGDQPAAATRGDTGDERVRKIRTAA